jgi:hypothetical protein
MRLCDLPWRLVECSLISSLILAHRRCRLSATLRRCVLRLGRPRLGREIAGADRSAVYVAGPLPGCPRWFDMGSLAADATYPCRLPNGIAAGAAWVSLVGHHGRQRLEQPAAGVRSVSRRGRTGDIHLKTSSGPNVRNGSTAVGLGK